MIKSIFWERKWFHISQSWSQTWYAVEDNLDLLTLCLCYPSAGITGADHHTCILSCAEHCASRVTGKHSSNWAISSALNQFLIDSSEFQSLSNTAIADWDRVTHHNLALYLKHLWRNHDIIIKWNPDCYSKKLNVSIYLTVLWNVHQYCSWAHQQLTSPDLGNLSIDLSPATSVFPPFITSCLPAAPGRMPAPWKLGHEHSHIMTAPKIAPGVVGVPNKYLTWFLGKEMKRVTSPLHLTVHHLLLSSSVWRPAMIN